jgi:DHA3 family tetracycline resistance protein-like MFS transporter
MTGFAFWMAATATSVYLITRLGLNPLELVLVGTVLEITVTLCEVPTGVVADTVSRKLSIIIGLVLIAAGFTLYAVPNYAVILAGQVVWGLGYTFTSGADVAWITDEIGETEARPLYVRAAQVKQVAHLAGIVAGGALGVVALWAPILVGGLLHLGIAAWLFVRMPETGFVRPADGERHRTRDTVKHARRTLLAHPALFLVLGVVLLTGLASEGKDRLWQLHLIADTGLPGGLQPIVWISALHFVGLVAALGVTELVRRRADLQSDHGVERTIELVVGGMIVTTVLFGFAGSFWMAAALLVAVYAVWEAADPVIDAWVNRGLDPRTRATINSLASQAHAIGETAGGPIFGTVALSVSTPAALVAAGLAQLPSMFVLGRRRRIRLADPPTVVVDAAVTD